MLTKSLAESRWATPQRTRTSTTTRTPISRSRSPSPLNPDPARCAQELSRFMKIVSRLKWKLPFLSAGYRTATGAFGLSPTDVANAEIMFKIDFHEYYALLERAIVHLLAVFGIGIHDSRYERNHRYHANVLEALERKSCPLYPVLGSGPVREQLRRAKLLRNQWKTADSPEEGEQQRPVLPLESYDLEATIMGIFGGLEHGHALAEEYISNNNAEMDIEIAAEANWDFIVDAMDWEAI